MSYLGRWLPTTIVVVAALTIVQRGALAKTAQELNQTAQAITVKISYTKRNSQGEVSSGNGSGILLQQAGDVYTVLTAAHVVRGKIDETITISTIATPDGQQYKLIADSTRVYRGNIDLAVIKFRSYSNYKLADLGNSNTLGGGMELYVAGFPDSKEVIKSGFVFREGRVTANSKQPFRDGYALLYSNDTSPGMSGGPVLNGIGKVVGIHGRGDRNQESQLKTGFNAGIPIARFADVAGGMGVDLGSAVARTVQSSTLTADDYFVSARQKDDDGDYRGALVDLDRMVALKPNAVFAYFFRSTLKYQLKDFQGAVAELNKAIALNPNFADIYSFRGVLKDKKLNDSQGALADFNKAISLNPDLAWAYNHRSALRFTKLNDPQGALADLNTAIALKPDFAEAYSFRGTLRFIKLNDPKGALADLNKAIAFKPDFAEAYSMRSSLKYRLNDFQGALADCNRAMSLNPNLATTYFLRGNLKSVQLNDFQGALADLNKAIALKPDFAEAYYHRGFLKYEKLNDFQGALADLNKAIALKPDYVLAYLSRSLVQATKLNNRSGAIADLRQAARLARAQRDTELLKSTIKFLHILGATE
jgi:tetratricopeptide (TPR) repeat protein